MTTAPPTCTHCGFPLDSYDRCFCPKALRDVLRGAELRPVEPVPTISEMLRELGQHETADRLDEVKKGDDHG